MARKVMIVLLVMGILVASMGSVSAQDTSGPATQVRVASFFYSNMNVLWDGEPAFTNLRFSFVSDYVETSPGAHVLTVVSAGSGTETPLEMDLIEGHSYLVVAGGNWETDELPTLLVFDETDIAEGMEGDDNYVMFLHLVSGNLAVDGYVDDEPVGANVSYGQMVVFKAPVGTFTAKMTLAGLPNFKVYEDDFINIPKALTLVVAAGTSAQNMFLIVHSRSPITVADYIAAVADVGGDLTTLRTVIDTAGVMDELAGDGPLTFFAPVNWVFDELPEGALDALLADPAYLADVVRYHAVPAYLPPYVLYGQDTLTTLQGGSLSLTFPDDDWWQINGSISIYEDVRLGNGVVYFIGGVLLPE